MAFFSSYRMSDVISYFDGILLLLCNGEESFYFLNPDHVRGGPPHISKKMCKKNQVNRSKGPFKYVTLFSREFDPHPHPPNANNVEPYTFVMLFSPGKLTPTHPHRVM